MNYIGTIISELTVYIITFPSPPAPSVFHVLTLFNFLFRLYTAR